MAEPVLLTPQGNVPAINAGTSQDYARLVFSAPYFNPVAIAEIIEPSVQEAVEGMLPSLVPQYVDAAAAAAVQSLAVLLNGSTMTGPLYLSPLMPTAASQAATKSYVDSMVATAGVPEVPPTPVGQSWVRQTGQWAPINPQTGVFLPLSGGTMQGIINMGGNAITNLPAVPSGANAATPMQWVLNQIAAQSLYQGTWNMDTYTPDLTLPQYHQNNYSFIAITTSPTGVVIAPAIPGLQGTTVYNGDQVIWSNSAGRFQSIHAGGLTLPEADARYLQLAGGQMSGSLLLHANAAQPTEAVTLQQMQAAVSTAGIGEAPNDGQLYGRNGATQHWSPVLPLAGGIMTGPITLSGNATTANNPTTLTQMNSAISAATSPLLPLAGGVMTGLLTLSGNAANPLNAVPLQQLNAMLNIYVNKSGDTMTGALLVNLNAAPPPSYTATVGSVPGLWAAAANNTGSTVLVDTFGSGSGVQSSFVGRHARGTAAAPTATQSLDNIAVWAVQGYGATGYSANFTGRIVAQAGENWTDTAQGTQLQFFSTPNGSNGAAVSLTLQGATATFYGTINAAGAIQSGGNIIGGGASQPTIGGVADNGQVFLSNSICMLSSASLSANNAYLNGGAWKYAGNGPATVFNQGGGEFIWYTAASGSAGNPVTFLQAMVVDNGGNLTATQLIANGPISSTTTSGGLFLHDRASLTDFWTTLVNGGNYQIVHSGNSELTVDFNGNLTILGATATKASGTTWANPSSRDIKQDIRPYDQGLQAILALNPVTYRFNDISGYSTSDTHIGLVHDETNHMPEMHKKTRIGAGPDSEGQEVDALDCSPVTWALVNAVKELAIKVDGLEKRSNGRSKGAAK